MRIHLIAALSVLSAMPASAQSTGVDSPMPVTLDLLRDCYRPVLVFAPSTTHKFIQQMRSLAQGGVPMHERNLITVPLLLHEDNKSWGVVFNGNDDIGQMPPAEQAAARRRFHVAPADFTVILIGKDGDEKLRSHQPISLNKLRSTIDAMPMRQEEVRQKRSQSQ
jgi:hypothetical protein